MLRRYVSAFAGSLAFHAGVIGALVWLLSVGDPQMVAQATPESAIPAFLVPPEDPKFPGLNPVDPALADTVRTLAQDQRAVSVGGFTFDAGKIAERALVLFPFVSPGVALEHFGLRLPDGVMVFERARRSRPGQTEGSAGRPLALSETALQALVDRTWARRERWKAFDAIRELASRHSPSDGQLPALLQRYTDQNALQPYRDKATPDPRMWAQLGIAADHVSFIGFIRDYAAAHPSTRARIELLFLLDRIAEASQDALVALLDTDPFTDLRWTRESNQAAYQLAVRLRGHYRAELSRRGLSSPAAMSLHYDGVRLRILEGILRSAPAGYRANDARFLIGTILWRQGRQAEAIRAWRALSCAPTDTYLAACTQLARVFAAPAGEADVARQITRVLKGEQGRWWDLSYDRLKRFGYRFDTY
jgi:hypothetical protein